MYECMHFFFFSSENTLKTKQTESNFILAYTKVTLVCSNEHLTNYLIQNVVISERILSYTSTDYFERLSTREQ